MGKMQELLGIAMMPMREWLSQQDWSARREVVGSVSG